MSSRARPWSRFPSFSVAWTLLLLFLAGPAASQTPSSSTQRFPAQQPVPLAARVALLEQRVHALDQRMKAFERVSLETRPAGEYALRVNGAQVVIARDGAVTITPATPSAARSAPTAGSASPHVEVDPCDPPFSVDAKGMKSIKPECLKVGPCEPPYEVDAQGRRTPKKECL